MKTLLLLALVLRVNACIAPLVRPDRDTRPYDACAAAPTCAQCTSLASRDGCGWCAGRCVAPQADGGAPAACGAWVRVTERCPAGP